MTRPKLEVGYTLLEILVVLVIIAIATSMAMLTIGHNQNKQLEAFTNTLTQTLSLAEEEALMQPTTLSLRITPKHFGFYEFKTTEAKSSWQPLDNHELGLQAIPKDIQLTLSINDKTISSTSDDEFKPSLFISPNGNLTPFRILIATKGKPPRYEIIGRGDGTLLSRVVEG